ncbi:MAG: D-alanyl-D-alanine carboxypeptidase [Bacilli bacterium]|nr:D-alanyl-D-alanine carboxypeptidase [Bacilli bacterium]
MKRQYWLKLTILFIVIMSFFLFKIEKPVTANELGDDFVKEAKSAILIEVNTGKVLYEKNAHEKRSPASMTKIMAIYLVLEAIDKGQIKWDDVVTVSEHAASYGGSQVYLEPGEKMTVEDLFKCMVIASANDATVALAEHVAGSEELFVKRMNDKIKEWGLQNTVFIEPTGLAEKDEGHYSTAYDMAMIARELLRKYEKETTKYSSIYEDYIRKDTPNPFWLVNTNKLVRHVPGIDGLKTGWTSSSGYNLTATMKKDGMRLISVIMGETSSSQRNYDTVKLLNYGFSQYEAYVYRPKDYVVDEYDHILLTPRKVKVIIKEPIVFVVKKGEKPEGLTEKFTYEINRKGVSKNEVIGKLEIIQNDQVVYTVPLYVDEDCKKASIFEVLNRLLKNIFFN